MKTCKDCGSDKALDCFHNHNATKDRKSPYCKECACDRSRKWTKNNFDRAYASSRKFRKENPEKWREYQGRYYRNNKEKIAAKKKEINQRPEAIKRRRENDARIYHERLKHDPLRVLSNRVKVGIRRTLNGACKSQTTWDLLGYTAEQLRDHIESLFTEGMSWEAFKAGEIHIDHIRPLCSFEMKDFGDDEFRKAWALDNLQPLWAQDNMKKSGKLPEDIAA